MSGKLPLWIAIVLPVLSLAGCGETGGEAAWGPPIELAAESFVGEPAVHVDGVGNAYVARSESTGASPSEVWVTVLPRRGEPQTDRLGAGLSWALAVTPRGRAAVVVGSASTRSATVFRRQPGATGWTEVDRVPGLDEVSDTAFDTRERLVIVGRSASQPTALLAVSEADDGRLEQPSAIGVIVDFFSSARLATLAANGMGVLWTEAFRASPRVPIPLLHWVAREAGRWGPVSEFDLSLGFGRVSSGGPGDAYLVASSLWRFTVAGGWNLLPATALDEDFPLAAPHPAGIFLAASAGDASGDAYSTRIVWGVRSPQGVGATGELDSPVKTVTDAMALATFEDTSLLAWTQVDPFATARRTSVWASYRRGNTFETPIEIGSSPMTSCPDDLPPYALSTRAALGPSGSGLVAWLLDECDRVRLVVRRRS